MKSIAFFALCAVLVMPMAVIGADEPAGASAYPPSVVASVPTAGDLAVDPDLSEIRVTFSKPMMTDQMWSWCSESPETFPTIDANGIRYLEDGRTCVLPVDLKPDHSYVIWVNCAQHNAFRDLNGTPAVPYQLVFKTAAQH